MMEQQSPFTLPERPPEYFLDHNHNHDPNTLHLPSIPSTILKQPEERSLPPISSLTQESDNHFRPVESIDHVRPPPLSRPEEPAQFWPSANPLAVYYQPSDSHVSPLERAMSSSADSPNAMDVDSGSRGRRAGSVLSMDDPDVRMAAEALGDLRADFIASPPQQATSLPTSHPSFQHAQTQAEPMFSRFTPNALGNTIIRQSFSAYSTGKNCCPRLKPGFEYIEQQVLNTVGTVGKVVTLVGRRPGSESDESGKPGHESEASKKRKLASDPDDSDMDRHISRDPYHPLYRPEYYEQRERRTSQLSGPESLPAYDDYRSPKYEEHAIVPTQQQADGPASPRSWSSRMIIGTAGAGVAMSEESLRSLKYCLTWLRCANEHIGKLIGAVRGVLEQYERTLSIKGSSENGAENEAMAVTVREDRARLNAHIAGLRADVLKTLQKVVDVVSRYAGGALPENARMLVRRHLTSVPQRIVPFLDQKTEGQEEVRVKERANKVILLAKEGLDMMAQISGVVDGTIVSAEQWIDSFSKKKEESAASGSLEDGLGLGVGPGPMPFRGDEKEKMAEFWDEVRKS